MAHGHIADPAVLDGAALVVFNSHSLSATVCCPAPWIVCHPPVDPGRYRTTPGARVTLVNLNAAKGAALFENAHGFADPPGNPHHQSCRA
jgi:hypothetical protein